MLLSLIISHILTFRFVFWYSNCVMMLQRWSKTHDLLIEGGLTYDAIKKSVENSSIAFREGVVELFEFLEVNDQIHDCSCSYTCMVRETANYYI